jgi:hypothetical protein
MSWLHRVLGADGLTQLAVEAYRKSARVCLTSRGERFSIEALTGTIAAASNGSVFVMRNSPTSPKDVCITLVELDYNTITAFTTPVTQRRLQIIRGSGAAMTGGTAITPIAQHDSSDPTSQLNGPNGGDVRVSTTAVLTPGAVTFDTNALGNLVLTQFGAANARPGVKVFDYGSTDRGSIVLQPGELLAIRTSAAFDAGGTWQLGINISGYQVAPQTGE